MVILCTSLLLITNVVLFHALNIISEVARVMKRGSESKIDGMVAVTWKSKMHVVMLSRTIFYIACSFIVIFHLLFSLNETYGVKLGVRQGWTRLTLPRSHVGKLNFAVVVAKVVCSSLQLIAIILNS